MHDVTQALCPHFVALDLDAASRWEALHAVSTLIGMAGQVNGATAFRALWRREKAASTAVGNGFAIPHARITGISEPLTMYARARSPLDFAAPDHKPVSEMFVILVPADGDNAAHLALLALVAEAFSEPALRTQLAAASRPQDVRAAITAWAGARHGETVVRAPEDASRARGSVERRGASAGNVSA